MTDELDDDTLERFAIQTEHLEPKDADFEYSRLIAKERSRRKYEHLNPALSTTGESSVYRNSRQKDTLDKGAAVQGKRGENVSGKPH